MEGIKTRELLASPEFQVGRAIPAAEQEEGYLPFLLRSVMPDVRLTFALYVKTFDKQLNKVAYLPFCAENEIFQGHWLTQLQEKGFDRLYFAKESLDSVIAYLNNFLLCLDQESPEEKVRLTIVYDHLNLTLHRLLASPNLGGNIQAAVQQVEHILHGIEQETLPLSSLWEVICTEYHLYNHSVNVFLITSAFMAYLKKDFQDTRLLGIAALLHDIGLLKVPPEILYKNDELNAREASVIQKHPRLGFEMLRGCDAVPLESQRLILEHHENRDGSGYPQGLEFWQQHPYTHVLRLVDAYDALTSHRPHRPAFSAATALGSLLKQKGPKGHVFDQALLKTFIKFLAF
jgi:HD-GYP domain-containing protein (c-di-GMP phosphodiesterase class II)